MNSLIKLSAIFIMSGILSFTLKAQSINLQAGDLLFRGASSESLSEAIDRVTQTGDETHFSHIGIVESVADGIWILHADTKEGTSRISLQGFMHPENEEAEVVVYRLKNEYRNSIPDALERARTMLGKPYNFSYLLTDTAHYCSEFIYRAFAPDSIFEMNPMTFKDPETGEFYPTWVDYYRELGVAIPEGEPGCNPNGMAASDKLIRLGVLEFE